MCVALSLWRLFIMLYATKQTGFYKIRPIIKDQHSYLFHYYIHCYVAIVGLGMCLPMNSLTMSDACSCRYHSLYEELEVLKN